MRVLVVNAGSSSLKLSLVAGTRTLRTHTVESWDGDIDPLNEFVRDAGSGVDVVAHRVVHGGAEFSGAVVVDDRVRKRVTALAELAPLHQERALAGMDAVRQVCREVPEVACFDTAFHHRMPDEAATYALPGAWRQQWGLRRYGFHGLSHGYAARRTARLLGRPRRSLRMVTAHLGAGASLCAVRSGRSVDTTMGFTPLEGLVMATRSGTVDPGLLLWLLQQHHLALRDLADGLQHHSGLLGLTGSTADMAQVTKRASEGDPRCRLALDVYVHRLAQGVAAMAAAMDGCDALTFTGGVGENSPTVRRLVARRLGFLGIQIDPRRNRRAEADTLVSANTGRVAVLVVRAREDLEMARQARSVMATARDGSAGSR